MFKGEDNIRNIANMQEKAAAELLEKINETLINGGYFRARLNIDPFDKVNLIKLMILRFSEVCVGLSLVATMTLILISKMILIWVKRSNFQKRSLLLSESWSARYNWLHNKSKVLITLRFSQCFNGLSES